MESACRPRARLRAGKLRRVWNRRRKLPEAKGEQQVQPARPKLTLCPRTCRWIGQGCGREWVKDVRVSVGWGFFGVEGNPNSVSAAPAIPVPACSTPCQLIKLRQRPLCRVP
eukprot:2804147-Rhodomonas_salina.2